MKRKIFYFIISCIFAVMASANTANHIDTVFRDKTVQNSILNSENRKKTKDYTAIIINKIQPVQKSVFKNNFEEYIVIDFEDIEIEKNTVENDKLIEKNRGIPPAYTILYRYETRVLRL